MGQAPGVRCAHEFLSGGNDAGPGDSTGIGYWGGLTVQMIRKPDYAAKSAKWTMHAQRSRGPGRKRIYVHFGREGWARLAAGEGVVKVEIMAVPALLADDTDYWGWVDATDNAPVYIQHDYDTFVEVFRAGDRSDPGPKVAEDEGRGQILRLRVRELKYIGR